MKCRTKFTNDSSVEPSLLRIPKSVSLVPTHFTPNNDQCDSLENVLD